MRGKSKSKRTKETIGCTYDFLRLWFEYRFDENMSFENHGELWDIDHVIPRKNLHALSENENSIIFSSNTATNA